MNLFKIKVYIFLIGFLVLLSPTISAQIGSSLGNSASNIKSEQLTDAQLQVIMQRALESGMTPDQIEALARSRGMSEYEIDKIMQRAERLYDSRNPGSAGGGRKISSFQMVDYPKPYDERFQQYSDDIFFPSADEKEEVNFGFSLFKNSDLTFEPSFNVATPPNYLIGPGDILNIDVWGASQHGYQEIVSNEGTIIISNVGPILLNGFSIEEANNKLKRTLSKIYAGLNKGNTFLKVSLGTIRSIKVNIVGEVTLPGTYNLSSLASVFNAMYAAGGPSENGSLRDVKIIRGNKIAAEVDFYEYLLKGQLSNKMHLQDQDVIFVSPYVNRVEIKGAIKRNKQFDIKSSESLKDLIYFAGGFTGNAYTERIKIFRKTGKENRILDISADYLEDILLQNGDEVIIDSILNRFENRVQISGAIMRPGAYAIESSSSLKQLIKNADGLREDVFKNRISVFRLQDDLSRENIAIDLVQLLNSNLDFPLQREDSVNIPSIYDLRESYSLRIEGEISKPGVYPFAENTKVEDLIIQAGGLLETASLAYVEVARRIKDDQAFKSTNQLAQIIKFPISHNLLLSDSATEFTLQPYDQVFIRRSPAYMPQLIVSIDGEVNFPGMYSITTRTERISDLIKRAGNITSEAYLKGASLIRKKSVDKILTDKAIKSLVAEKEDSNTIVISKAEFDIIGVDLEKILKNPGSPSDLFLQEGDSIRILKQSQTVKVSGSVYSPNVIPYYKGFNLKNYITNAGGFTKEAKPGHIYVVYANGSVKKTNKILFFRTHPKIEPGAEIIVPTKPENKSLSLTETIGIGSAASSIALLLVTIINSLK